MGFNSAFKGLTQVEQSVRARLCHNVRGLRHNVFGLEQCRSCYLKKHEELKETRFLLPYILSRSALGFSLPAGYSLVYTKKKSYSSASVSRTEQVNSRNNAFD